MIMILSYKTFPTIYQPSWFLVNKHPNEHWMMLAALLHIYIYIWERVGSKQENKKIKSKLPHTFLRDPLYGGCGRDFFSHFWWTFKAFKQKQHDFNYFPLETAPLLFFPLSFPKYWLFRLRSLLFKMHFNWIILFFYFLFLKILKNWKIIFKNGN